MAGSQTDIPDAAKVEEPYLISIDLTVWNPNYHVRIPKSAKNVDVQIFVDIYSFSLAVYPEELALEFKSFNGTNCWVRLKYTQIDLEEREWSPKLLTEFFETLYGFENVYLYLYLDVGNNYHPRDRRVLNVRNSDLLTQILLTKGFGMLKTLGPMNFRDSDDPKARYLEFHPRRFYEEKEMGELDSAEFTGFDKEGGEKGLAVSVKSSESNKKRKAESAEDFYTEGIDDQEAKRLKKGNNEAM
ncbi:hypothetical protein N7G274_008107 [Stereocaulon virgatum]|uniref:Uncharacterized protein n=1 Tax=Stereocaulon virgatum TaxID=373712 RepID=A0ABR4A098_9LECA